MAYRPSQRLSALRGHDLSKTTELEMKPVMNLMVVLIPLLLSTAEFVKLSVIELNLPAAVSETAGGPVEEKINLAVTITDQGFFISSKLAVLGGDVAGGPTIPRIAGQGDSLVYDFRTLTSRLFDIKKRIRESAIARRIVYSDSLQIILTAEPNIEYQTVVSTMDAARSIVVGNQEVPLFPDVSLSAGIY